MKLALPSAPRDTSRTWSPQQLEVFKAVESWDYNGVKEPNIQVEAVAGSGKTTTLVEACARMRGQVAFCAFNKKIADEIAHRVKDFPHVKAGTFHAFGYAAWRAANPLAKIKVEAGKMRILAAQLGQSWELRKFSTKAVGLAKSAMLLPDSPEEQFRQCFDHHDAWDELDAEEFTETDGIDSVRALLRASIVESTVMIDFDDMLYMPLQRNVPFPQYDWVLIDEAQDSNMVRRAVAAKLLKLGGRILSVGDRHQAIYGFTGADNDALDIISRDFGCVDLPLTTTYRCPKAVVRHAQTFVSHIQAAETAPEGAFDTIDELTFWKSEMSNLTRDDAILCRNTKPLISLAFELIRHNIGCHVEGREIGESLIKLVDKFGKARTLDELKDNLEEYKHTEVEKLLQRGQDGMAAGVEDRVDTLLVVIDSLDGRGDPMEVKLKLSILFGDTVPGQPSPSLTLSTIHKSKGREWKRVFHWGRSKYCPSRYAKKDWQKQQETNLVYVATTRAMARLVEVEVL